MYRHFLFIFLYILFINFFSPEATLVLLIIHCLVGIGDNLLKRQISLFTGIYATTLFSTYCNLVLVSDPNANINSVYKYIDLKYIPEATLIWCIGNALLFLGYEALIKKSFADISILIQKKHLVIIYITVLSLNILGLSGYSINFSFLGSGGSKVVTLLNIISILIFARLWTKENNKKYLFYSLALCVTQTILALKTSYLRQEIIIPTLSFMGGYFMGLGNFKYLITYRIIPFAIIIILYFQLFKNLGASRSHFIDVVYSSNTNSINEFNSDLDAASLEEKNRGGIFDRLSNIAQITNCVKLTKVNGFYEGKASAPLVTALVPRILWPEKPSIRLGAWFAVEIGQAYVNPEGGINNSINMTIPGELYLDFGWVGVILGCFLFGGVLAMFWNASHFTESAYNLTGILWGGYLIQSGLGGYNSGDLQIIITLFSTYIIFYIIKKIIKK